MNDFCGEGGCLEGYTGAYCTECGEGLVLDADFECHACPSAGIVIGVMCGLLVLAFSIVALNLYHKRKGRTPSALGVWFKVVWSALQANAVAMALYDWSDIVNNWLKGEQDIASGGVSYFNFACFIPEDSGDPFTVETTFYALGPMAVAFIVSVVLSLHASCQVHSDGGGWAVLKQEIKSSVIGVTVVLMFILQPFLTARTAELLACVRLGPQPDDLFLARDLNVRCWVSTQHQLMLIFLGVPMFVVYVVGVPLLFTIVLCKHTATIERVSNHMGIKVKVAIDPGTLMEARAQQKSGEVDEAMVNVGRHFQSQRQPPGEDAYEIGFGCLPWTEHEFHS